MSHLFATPTKADPSFCEGVITEVDPIRLFCKVKTTKGQNLVEVAWMMPSGGSSRSGALFIPIIGDRVIVNSSLGYPVIFGYLPKISIGEIFSTNIDTGEPEADTGDFSPLSDGLTVFGEKTGDANAGDILFTTEGGALLGVLRGGSILAKASRLAQVFITKWDDLVRIVARNYEVFTDSLIKVSANVRGRVYTYKGYANTQVRGRNDEYIIEEFFGDTALAESLKGNYIGADPGSFPVANTIAYKLQTLDASGNVLNTRTIDLNGVVEERVQNSGGTAVTSLKHDSGTITIKYNSQATIMVSATNIIIDYASGGHVVIDANGVKSTMGSHFVTLDNLGVHLG